MVKIDLQYQGDLRVNARHQPSGTTLHTDAPVDNHGKGESFSPTDLLATSLGSCMATVMGIAAEKKSIDLKGMEIAVEKHMSTDAPRRVRRLDVNIAVPKAPPEAERLELENIARHCPVAESIHPQIEVVTNFKWGS